MKTPKMNFKAILSLVVSLSIASAFSLSSLAASGSSEKMHDPSDENLPALQAPTGNLTTRGPVLVNGTVAAPL